MDNLEKVDSKDLEKAIEAILFAAGHPMSYSKLGEVLGYTESQIRKTVRVFSEKYNADTERGIMMLTFEDSCQLCTKESFLPYIKEALGIKKGGNLSASSLEVLAIIAYNEPVTRAFVDTVRKVDSAYIVASLCEKNLIEICGRLDVPGRPYLYRTTPTFLRCFGIESLEQLPYVDTPRQKNEGEIIPLDVEMPESHEGEDVENEPEINVPDVIEAEEEELELIEGPQVEIDTEDIIEDTPSEE
ncbi:MAG: SMC-Scp complex subunit ScpB [Clostridia bacterium]|nr:SMC-Scp complex subunit ScpB [Clostridia bacterium]